MDPPKISPPMQHFSLGNFTTQAGDQIPDCQIAYKTWGNPNLPLILYPTWYSGAIEDNEWLIGDKSKSLNPEKFFIIVVAMFGNGQSSSPSNTKGALGGSHFPPTTIYDNVKAQHQLVESLGIKSIFCVTGWSMGAAQTFQWGAAYPEMCERLVPFCGAARTAHHNITFLRALTLTLKLDPEFLAGNYTTEKQLEGKKGFAAIYSIMGFSQTFYREERFKSMHNYPTLESFLVGFWEPIFAHKDANDLLHLLDTWIRADITTTPDRAFSHSITGGRSDTSKFVEALKSIKAKMMVMPGKTDLYFPSADSSFEVENMPNAVLNIIPSENGHFAGFPVSSQDDFDYIDSAIASFFSTTK